MTILHWFGVIFLAQIVVILVYVADFKWHILPKLVKKSSKDRIHFDAAAKSLDDIIDIQRRLISYDEKVLSPEQQEIISRVINEIESVVNSACPMPMGATKKDYQAQEAQLKTIMNLAILCVGSNKIKIK